MQTPPMQYSAAGQQLIALLALVVVVLICKWVFSTTHRDRRTAARLKALASRGDYGLLVPVATVRTARDAEMLRGVLQEAGIRGTVADGETDGERVVLVFHGDADRARTLV